MTPRAVLAVQLQEAARIAKRRERAAEKAQAVRDEEREEVEKAKRRARHSAKIARTATALRKSRGRPDEQATPKTSMLPLEHKWDGQPAMVMKA